MKKLQNIVKAILLVLPLLFTACKSNKEIKVCQLLLTMTKTDCLGPCPNYTVNFYTDGKMDITPKAYAIVKKNSSGRLTEAQLSNLKKKIEALKVEDLQTKYDDKLLMDAPSTILTFYTTSPKKEIKARIRFPEKLKIFIKELEAIVKTTNWKSA